MKIKCTSKNISKARMKLKMSSTFKKTTMLAKIKHSEIKKNVFTFKIMNFSRATIKATSSQMFKVNLFSCKSFCTNAHKKCEEYLIKNENIKNNIIDFKSVTNIFIKLYNMKSDKKIIIRNDTPYVLLKYNENKIVDIEQFRKMKVEDLIDDQLFYSLSCL